MKYVFRQLIFEPFRTSLTMLAIASALALIMLLEGFQTGLLQQLKNVALNRGADLIVAQSGVSNFVATRSLLPQLSRERIESIPGVKAAHPITMFPVIYSQQNYRRSPIFFVVYDTAGGPATLLLGEEVSKPRDVVIDNSLATLYELKVGDPFEVAEFQFMVAGISEHDSALFTAFVFINYDDMIDFFFDSDLVGDISNLPLLSYLLVELYEDVNQHSVLASIEKTEPDGDVFFPEDLAENDLEMGRTLFGPVMGVLIGAGYIIALLVVGMIVFSTVHSRLQNIGVLKALGFTQYRLIWGVLLESLLLVLMSFPVALFLAVFAARIIETNVPLYLVSVVDTYALLRTFIAAIVLSAISAYLPFKFISKLDPAIVFKG